MASRAQEVDRRPRCPLLSHFHYGLERAAILSDVEAIGGVDWYAAGAGMLCAAQTSGGGWWADEEFRPSAPRAPQGHVVDTAFAVLFLARKFQKVQGSLTGLRQPRSALLPADADDPAVHGAAGNDGSRGETLLPALLALLHSDVVARRKAAVLAIFTITGQDFGVHPYREPSADAAAIRAAELWWLRRRAAK